MMPTIELMIKIVVISTNKQAEDYFFEASTQADEVSSQALIALLADFLLVDGHPCVWRQTFGVLLYADFLRVLVFFFLFP
jgi:hypothetical protein